MSRIFARSCLTVLVIIVAAFYLPQLYEQLFCVQVEKTHLFYSPVSKQFIYKEKIVGTVPEEVQQKSEEEINAVAYRTEKGEWLHRLEFERLLPFIYYKDMEVRGLLPVIIDGQSFSKKEIKAQRRVLELRAREMSRPQTKVYPLFVSAPQQARLVFPKDRFFSEADRVVFVNAVTGKEETTLSRNVTTLLKKNGFQFPVVKVFGNFTVLKPFDAGVFLLDSAGQLFHMQRREKAISVDALLLPQGLKVKYLRVAESRASLYCGIVVGESNNLYLLQKESYRLVPLSVTGYNPAIMDLKIIFNPLYVTAVFSDNKMIYAVAFNKELETVACFQHQMSRAEKTLSQQIYHMIFPFSLVLETKESSFVELSFRGGRYAPVGMLFSLFVYIFFIQLRHQTVNGYAFCLVFFFGIYGLLVLFCLGVSSVTALSSADRKMYNKK